MTENKVLKAYDDLILSKGFETASFLAKQDEATKRMLANSKIVLNQALETWRNCLENERTRTRELIGRILTGIKGGRQRLKH